MQGWFSVINKYNLSHKQTQEEKPHGYLIRCKRATDNSTSLHDKSPGEIVVTRNIAQQKRSVNKPTSKNLKYLC